MVLPVSQLNDGELKAKTILNLRFHFLSEQKH